MSRLRSAVLVIAVVGCGGPSKRVPTYDIVVRHDHAGHVGVGHATLLGEAAEIEPDSSPHRRLAGARAWLAIAEELEALGQFADAYEAAREGIAGFGDEYRPRALKDDTGLALKVAELDASKGAHDAAARKAISVLEQRIQLYARKYRGIAE